MLRNRDSDTIAAISTATGNAGIGIVRISGNSAIEIADHIFKGKKQEFYLKDAASHTVHYGMIQDGDNLIDEVLVLVMKGPNSYTAEDTVEIDCHGGALVVKKILETVIKYGARPAEPGEFTKRAFLNGRIDLSQAEAVIDVINAQNEYAMKSSLNQLKGSLSNSIKRLRENLLYQIAFIESALDDPEHISLEGYGASLLSKIELMLKEIDSMIQSSDNGKLISEGIQTVILGKPNAGKSSLMNLLTGEERAIVTDIAGTTRDTLEEKIYFHGITLNVVDTAGIRHTDDVVERIGVSRAKDQASKADLVIYMVDGSLPLDENDEIIMKLIYGKKIIVLVNKSDLKTVVSEKELEDKTGGTVISFSAKEKTGVDKLEKTIQKLFYAGKINFNNQVLITNVRHRTALIYASESLNRVKQSILDQMPEDLFTIDMMDAYEQLGTIIGESVEDDLINEIFGKFCMGK